jgi:general secretion pathway protein G
MKRLKQNGFTLIEVLVVIVIIALLAALILGLAGNAQKSAARNKAEAEISQLESFVTAYQMKYGQVPGVADPDEEDFSALQDALIVENHSLTNLADPWGADYHYFKSSKVTFYIWSEGGPDNIRAKYIGNPKPE